MKVRIALFLLTTALLGASIAFSDESSPLSSAPVFTYNGRGFAFLGGQAPDKAIRRKPFNVTCDYNDSFDCARAYFGEKRCVLRSTRALSKGRVRHSFDCTGRLETSDQVRCDLNPLDNNNCPAMSHQVGVTQIFRAPSSIQSYHFPSQVAANSSFEVRCKFASENIACAAAKVAKVPCKSSGFDSTTSEALFLCQASAAGSSYDIECGTRFNSQSPECQSPSSTTIGQVRVVTNSSTPLKSSSISPSVVKIGEPYNVTCDYGAPVAGVHPVAGYSGAVSVVNGIGTSLNFNMSPLKSPGRVDVFCLAPVATQNREACKTDGSSACQCTTTADGENCFASSYAGTITVVDSDYGKTTIDPEYRDERLYKLPRGSYISITDTFPALRTKEDWFSEFANMQMLGQDTVIIHDFNRWFDYDKDKGSHPAIDRTRFMILTLYEYARTTGWDVKMYFNVGFASGNSDGRTFIRCNPPATECESDLNMNNIWRFVAWHDALVAGINAKSLLKGFVVAPEMNIAGTAKMSSAEKLQYYGHSLALNNSIRLNFPQYQIIMHAAVHNASAGLLTDEDVLAFQNLYKGGEFSANKDLLDRLIVEDQFGSAQIGLSDYEPIAKRLQPLRTSSPLNSAHPMEVWIQIELFSLSQPYTFGSDLPYPFGLGTIDNFERRLRIAQRWFDGNIPWNYQYEMSPLNLGRRTEVLGSPRRYYEQLKQTLTPNLEFGSAHRESDGTVSVLCNVWGDSHVYHDCMWAKINNGACTSYKWVDGDKGSNNSYVRFSCAATNGKDDPVTATCFSYSGQGKSYCLDHDFTFPIN